jgi:hypothetical protein
MPQTASSPRSRVSEELEQLGLVVGDASRQQPLAGVVDHHAVVMGFPASIPAQIAVTCFSAGRVRTGTTDDLAVESLLSDQRRNS